MDIKVNKNTVIVFDLDDTLYSEIDYLISAYKYIANELDSVNAKELFSVMFSMYKNKQNVFKYLEFEYSIPLNKLVYMYRNHLPNISLHPDVLVLFNSIKKNSGKIALLTDGRSITQRNKIKVLNLALFFDYFSISEEIRYEKPSLVGFKLIENQFNCDNYFYIGDNLKKDFIGPNELNWTTICLIDNGKNIHSNHNNKLDHKNKPDFFISSFKELEVVKG